MKHNIGYDIPERKILGLPPVLIYAYVALIGCLLIVGVTYAVVHGSSFSFKRDYNDDVFDRFCQYEGYGNFVGANVADNGAGIKYMTINCAGGGSYKVFTTRQVRVDNVDVMQYCKGSDGKKVLCDSFEFDGPVR